MFKTGLRISEAINLKITDIDSDRMQMRNDQGKGKKERVTLLSKGVLELLREYYRQYRPKHWLFEDQAGEQYSVTSIQAVFRRAKEKPASGNPSRFIPCVIVLPHTY
ncbi:MAG: tyrosine-type recombinase/integrase [Bacteroidales bacterium]